MKQWFVALTWHMLAIFTLFISFPLYCTQSTYYIKPTADTPCPGEPCNTLSQYGEEYFQNSSSNATLVFLPGEHTLNFTISVGTLPDDSQPDYYYYSYYSSWDDSQPDQYYPPSSLTLLGSPSSLPEITSRIVCTWPAGFIFSAITELNITALAFISCGHNDSAAINIWSVWNISITNCTFQNNTNQYRSGGAIYVHSCNLTLAENKFRHNYAHVGGAIQIDVNTIVAISRNTFQNNSADYAGGALAAYINNTLTLSENTFQNNSADFGGALAAYTNNTLTLSRNTFQNNSAEYGGALSANTNNTIILSENKFQNNSADVGGALVLHLINTLTLTVNTFQDNSADDAGGALYATINNTLILSENTFLSNSAVYGGALAIRQGTVNLTNNTLTGNTAELHGGAILCFDNCTLQAHGSRNIQNSTAQRGGAIAALGSQIILTGNITLENNTAYYGGGIYTEQSNISGYAYFSKNSAYRSGGGIYALRSNLYFEQYIEFGGNSALNGGGLLLADGSKLYLWPNTTVHFRKNSVQQKGGAIKVARSNSLGHCVQESCELLIGSECFFQIQTKSRYKFTTNISEIVEIRNVRMYFENNTALEAGAMLYGGSVDSCSLSLIDLQLVEYKFEPYTCPISGKVFDYINSVEGQSQDISSDPLYICSCEDGEPDCSAPSITRSVYPGGMIEVTIIVYGQRNGSTPAVVNMITPGDEITTKETEKTQNITKGCTALNYTVLTRKEGSNYEMTLHVGPCAAKERTVSLEPTNIFTVHVTIHECPPGFELSVYEPLCKCAQRLEQYTNTCSIADSKIECATDHEFWVGYKQDNTSDGLILHPHCPFDYCTSQKKGFHS